MHGRFPRVDYRTMALALLPARVDEDTLTGPMGFRYERRKQP